MPTATYPQGTIAITLSTNNDAFFDDSANELEYIMLNILAKMRVNPSLEHIPIYDINGNRVGDMDIMRREGPHPHA